MQKFHLSERQSWWLDIGILTVILSILFCSFLGNRPLFTPDEGRYAEIAREMSVNHDFVTPYLNDIKYFEKPPFFYWLGALAIKATSPSVLVLRFINAFFALFGCLFTYFTVRKCFDRSSAFYAALMLGTSLLYFVMARMISLDLPVTVFLSASLSSFLIASNEKNRHKQRYYFWSAAFFSALAVLTKGLIGVIFPSLIIGVWVLLTQQWRLLKSIPFISAALIFLIVALPWHILVSWRNPEFFYFYFIEQHILRYTTPDVGHYQPVWYFLPILCLSFFPWIIFLPQTLFSALRKRNRNLNYCLLWAGIIFLFFSFSKSKLIPYILPVIPPLSILTAHYLSHLKKSTIGFRLSLLVFVILVITCGASYIILNNNVIFTNEVAPFSPLLIFLLMTLTVGSLFCFITSLHRIRLGLSILLLTTLFFLFNLALLMPALDMRTVKPLAEIIAKKITPADEVITYNQYYQDLPFYLQQRVTILNWKNELTFGMHHQDTHAWMINNDAFSKKWAGPKRIFVIMKKDEFESFKNSQKNTKWYILGQTKTNILLSNRP